MFSHVPADLPTGRPLVVVLHGCTQTATAFADDTGWSSLADRWRFALLLPQQQNANNPLGCFNWFLPDDTARGSGEVLSIKQMIDTMAAHYGVDAGRVYVTGLSAGGAMAAAMLAAYPEVFAAGAIVSGLPYGCATTELEAYTCMNPGVDRAAATWGDEVRAASGHTGTWPDVSVWQGTSDTTVVPRNRTELVEQWTDVHGTDGVPDLRDTVAGYPHAVYEDAAGRDVVENYEITGMAHGQAIDPGTGPERCGTVAPYVLDAGICAAYHIGRFWGLDDLDSLNHLLRLPNLPR